MPFSSLFAAWLAEKTQTAKATSLSTYSILAEKHILPVLGEKEVIGESDIDLLQQTILAKGLSPKTAFICANLVKTVLNYASRQGWCQPPAWTLKDPTAERRNKAAIFTPAQQKKLLDYLTANRTYRNYAIYLALTAGVTSGELCSLRWQDIDFTAKVLHVRGFLSYRREQDEETGDQKWTAYREEKTAPRDIPLAPQQLRYLKPEARLHQPESFLLTGSDTPLSTRALQLHVAGFFKNLDIKNHQFKDLRHTFAVRCLESGCNYHSLAALLGSTDVNNLIKTYGKYVRQNLRRDVERMMDHMMDHMTYGLSTGPSSCARTRKD